MYRWTGEVLEPLGYFRQMAAAEFKPGETYRLVEVETRSMNSHKHFFACINEAWRNLREDEEQRNLFPSPEHLRKWALTYTPFCDVHEYRASSQAEAQRVARFLASESEYSRVEIRNAVVRHFKPLSQALQAMPNNKIFQQSKTAVLDVLARKLGVTVENLVEAGKRAA